MKKNSVAEQKKENKNKKKSQGKFPGKKNRRRLKMHEDTKIQENQTTGDS